MKEKKQVVFIVCTGLGHINRGYETFTNECFNVLKNNDSFDLYLLKGAGESSAGEITIKCITRDSKTAAFFARVFRQEDPYMVEGFTFLVNMLPAIIRYQPSVIYYCDFILGTFLWHLRKYFKFKYKLLFNNGAPNGPPFKTEDHVQQHLPMYIDAAVKGGTPKEMQTLLTCGVNIDKATSMSKIDNLAALRSELGLPENKKIIISVGALNTHHKRMDYVINEFAKLDMTDYFLLILGHISPESSGVIELAKKKLKDDAYLIKEVTADRVNSHLIASDYFVLASLNEGLPRVLPEALGAGLIPIVHDYQVTRQTLDQFGVFKDLIKEGALFDALKEVDNMKMSKAEIIDYSIRNYAWGNLKGKYIEMMDKFLN